MHVEFALHLANALEKIVPEVSAGFAPANQLRDRLLLQLLEVDDCPENVPAEITSSIAFKAAKKMSDSSGGAAPLGPAQLAAQLREEIVQAEPGYRIEIGGGGHLNVSIRPELTARWLNSAVRCSTDRLMSAGSLFGQTLSAPLAEPCVDWSVCVDRLNRRNDPELLAVVQDSQPAELSEERKLMLLGMLADAELDPRPYLAGLSGNQNLPWYFKRFFGDAEKFCTLNANFFSGSLHAVLSGDLPAEVLALARPVMHFRQSLFWSAATGRPEQLMAELLRIVRSFYWNYHHPKFRSLTATDLRPNDLALLVGLTSVSARLVRASLASFSLKEFLRSCGNAFNDSQNRAEA